MADFCSQCSMENFGEDFHDHRDRTKRGFRVVICEGCGITQVNSEGSCVSPDCLRRHGEGQETPWNT